MKTDSDTHQEAAGAGSSPSSCSGFFVMAADFRCTLEMCPPGPFFHGDTFGFKTEYRDENGPEAYCVESGEYFWGGTDDEDVRRAMEVTPCIIQNTTVRQREASGATHNSTP